MAIEFKNVISEKRPEWHKSDYYRVTVSTRRHDEVLPNLMLPDSCLHSSTTILDVGAGFSDVIDHLIDKYGVDGTAVDPIYDVLEGENFSTEKISLAIAKKYGSWVNFNSLYSKHEGIYIPNPENRLVGSIYSLGKLFPKDKADLIISNRLMEHIDFEIALSEMASVLKSNGEIRFSGCLLTIDANRKKLCSGGFDYDCDGHIGQHVFIPVKGFDNAINLAHNTGLTVYVLATELPRSPEVLTGVKGSEGEIYMGGLIIIRKDNKLPIINSTNRLRGSPGIPGEFTHIGELYRVGNSSKDDSKSLFIESFGFNEVKLYDLTSV